MLIKMISNKTQDKVENTFNEIEIKSIKNYFHSIVSI